jgi:ADP-ribose pyrophosphatase
MSIRQDKVLDPSGKKGKYSFVERGDAISIIAHDSDGGVFLLKEFRYPVQKTLWQLPAGHIEKGMSLLANAKKELKEETGMTAKKWKKLGSFYIHSGLENTLLHVFLAGELNKEKLCMHNQEDNEQIEHLQKISLPKLKKMIRKNRIQCGWSLASLNLFFLFQK